METTTIFYLLGVILLAYGYMKFTDRKKDVGKLAMLIGGVVVLATFFGSGGAFAGFTAGPTNTPSNSDGSVSDGTCQVKGYTNLNFSGDIWPTNDATAPAGSVDFYVEGVDPSQPTANRLTTIAVTAGVGGLANGVLESCTNYGIVYNGATAEYDQWYDGKDWTQPNQLPYISTTESSISKAMVKFDDIIVVATIPDPLDETATSGIINGQTNITGESSSSNEIQIGTDVTPAQSDIVYYNITNGDASYYLDITLGATGANAKLKDPVLCFVNDNTNPMDGNEWSSVTITRQSGTDFGIPTSITNYVNNADCVPMGSWIEAGQTGVYRLQFTGVEANMAATTDIMYIYPDDLGAYLGKDILRNTKATAGAVIEMRFEA